MHWMWNAIRKLRKRAGVYDAHCVYDVPITRRRFICYFRRVPVPPSQCHPLSATSLLGRQSRREIDDVAMPPVRKEWQPEVKHPSGSIIGERSGDESSISQGRRRRHLAGVGGGETGSADRKSTPEVAWICIAN